MRRGLACESARPARSRRRPRTPRGGLPGKREHGSPALRPREPSSVRATRRSARGADAAVACRAPGEPAPRAGAGALVRWARAAAAARAATPPLPLRIAVRAVGPLRTNTPERVCPASPAPHGGAVGRAGFSARPRCSWLVPWCCVAQSFAGVP